MVSLFRSVKYASATPDTPNTYGLVRNTWNDYGYYTAFDLYLRKIDKSLLKIGRVKIAEFDQKGEGKTQTTLSDKFDSLDSYQISIGASADFYETLRNEAPEQYRRVLDALNDVALDLNKFEAVIEKDIVQKSFLRNLDPDTVRNQLHRIASGGVQQTDYDIVYTPPARNSLKDAVRFEVKANSFPSMNLHVIIGANGVGKTFLMNTMRDAALADSHNSASGTFDWNDHSVGISKPSRVSNVLFISFSAFDKHVHNPNNNDLDYTYIGVGSFDEEYEENYNKDSSELLADVLTSLKNIASSGKINLLSLYLKEILSEVSSPAAIELQKLVSLLANRTVSDSSFDENTQLAKSFNQLSSGHKIVVSTIVQIVSEVRERTIVFFDEPETHLHPPLLARLVKTLGTILSRLNGVCVLATHSPVVLQEVPRVCCHILSGSAELKSITMPSIETYGENVGVLTRDVFRLEVETTGFYSELKALVDSGENYESIVEMSHGQLGAEARAYAKILTTYKKVAK